MQGGSCKGAKAVRLLAAQFFRAYRANFEGKALQALEFESDKARLSPEMQEKLLLLATSAIDAHKAQRCSLWAWIAELAPFALQFSRVEVSNS